MLVVLQLLCLFCGIQSLRFPSICLRSKHTHIHGPGKSSSSSSTALSYRPRKQSPEVEKKSVENIIAAFQKFKDFHGNLNIPIGFRVPESHDWPEELHGLRLGSTYRRIVYNGKYSNYHEDFEKVGIIMSKKDRNFENFVVALQLYEERYGTMRVPRSFNVPSEDPWPERCWNIKLGSKVSTTRQGVTHSSPECVEKLNEIGFVWDPLGESVDSLIAALEAYRKKYKNLNVPKNFIVPRNSGEFPKETWGMKLGLKTGNLIYRGDYEKHRSRFQELGIVIEKQEFDTRHWDYIYEALQVYKKIHGHLKIGSQFVVPRQYPWPEKLWDLKLGYRTNNIRYRGDFVLECPEYRNLLDNLGFQWRMRRKEGEDDRPLFEEKKGANSTKSAPKSGSKFSEISSSSKVKIAAKRVRRQNTRKKTDAKKQQQESSDVLQ